MEKLNLKRSPRNMMLSLFNGECLSVIFGVIIALCRTIFVQTSLEQLFALPYALLLCWVRSNERFPNKVSCARPQKPGKELAPPYEFHCLRVLREELLKIFLLFIKEWKRFVRMKIRLSIKSAFSTK